MQVVSLCLLALLPLVCLREQCWQELKTTGVSLAYCRLEVLEVPSGGEWAVELAGLLQPG